MLKLCGETEEKLAQELIQFENQIERDVVEPLYVLAEVGDNNAQHVTTGMCDMRCLLSLCLRGSDQVLLQ